MGVKSVFMRLCVSLCACSSWHFLIALKCVFRQLRDGGENEGDRERKAGGRGVHSCLSDSIKADGAPIKLLCAFTVYALFLIQFTKWRLNLTHSGHSWFRLSYTHISVVCITLTHWNKGWSIAILIHHYERTGPQILSGAVHGTDKTMQLLHDSKAFLSPCSHQYAMCPWSVWSMMAACAAVAGCGNKRNGGAPGLSHSSPCLS